MRSGNGRHRRPRQAPALVVAAGVTGSAIAIPLLGATGATAAEAGTWDRLAECESGGAWSADDGNGFYGGLQLSQETWTEYGGLAYATGPDQASRSQQITVGERVLAAQGPGAWPGCGVSVGLTKDAPPADVDPGVLPSAAAKPGGSDGKAATPAPSSGTSGKKGTSPSPSRTSDTSGSATNTTPRGLGAKGDARDKERAAKTGTATEAATDASPSAAPTTGAGDATATATDEPEAGKSTGGTGSADGTTAPTGAETSPDESPKSEPTDGASPSATADPATGEDTGAGRHRGGPATEEAVDSRAGDPAGRHASRGGATRDELDKSYTVQSGDNLWDIADSQGVEGGWSALYDGNKGTVGTDPDLILPGQSLDLVPETAEKKL
ncbi:transglycosylase family protein [Streptomyces uncialis]|uniref:transglycosylase family protein n=1 Tax=Streptomyces uncialis TaxID=1048205 RepID=UPI0037AA4A8F